MGGSREEGSSSGGGKGDVAVDGNGGDGVVSNRSFVKEAAASTDALDDLKVN